MKRDGFYQSDAWQKCRRHFIGCVLERDGALFCSVCGKEIINPRDAVVHHVKELDDTTVNDPDVALNMDNLTVVCHQCHNAKHEKGHRVTREKTVMLIYGGTEAEREALVSERATDGALVFSVPRLHKALSPRRTRARVLTVVWNIRDLLYNIVERRAGEWTEAWIVGEFRNEAERDALARRLGATCLDAGTHTEEDKK